MVTPTESDQKWKIQFRKGFLELCTLALVERMSKSYGFEMLGAMKSTGLDIGEGTLYPLLSRLSAEGKLESVWEMPAPGAQASPEPKNGERAEPAHPRKFYRLSDLGRDHLAAMAGEFEKHRRVYDSLKGGAA